MVKLVGTVKTVNPKLVTLISRYTTIHLPIKDPDVYLTLLKMSAAASQQRVRLRNIKFVTDDDKGYVTDIQARAQGKWISLLRRFKNGKDQT
jgi:hypothetical protein